MKQLASWAIVLGTLAACHKDTGVQCSIDHAQVAIMTVDDNTPTMLQIYKHAEADPAATQAGIKAQIDTWQADGQPKRTDYFLLGPDPTAIAKYVTSLPPELQPPSNEKLLFERTGAEWRSFLVSSTVLDQTKIAHVESTTNADRPALEISFTPEGRKTFADATEKAVGHKMATVIDGEITNAPVINSKISGGKAMITFSNAAEATALAKKLGC